MALEKRNLDALDVNNGVTWSNASNAYVEDDTYAATGDGEFGTIGEYCGGQYQGITLTPGSSSTDLTEFKVRFFDITSDHFNDGFEMQVYNPHTSAWEALEYFLPGQLLPTSLTTKDYTSAMQTKYGAASDKTAFLNGLQIRLILLGKIGAADKPEIGLAWSNFSYNGAAQETKTYTCDAYLKKTLTKTCTCDAYICLDYATYVDCADGNDITMDSDAPACNAQGTDYICGTASQDLTNYIDGADSGINVCYAAVGGTSAVQEGLGLDDNYIGPPYYCPNGDAKKYFGKTINLGKVCYVTTEVDGTVIEVRLTGLNITKKYDITFLGMRGGSGISYDRWTKYSLSGDDSFVAAHSSGAISGGSPTGRDCTYRAGKNYDEGYVARWEDVDPGSDGAVIITFQGVAEGGDLVNKGYLSAFTIVEKQSTTLTKTFTADAYFVLGMQGPPFASSTNTPMVDPADGTYPTNKPRHVMWYAEEAWWACMFVPDAASSGNGEWHIFKLTNGVWVDDSDAGNSDDADGRDPSRPDVVFYNNVLWIYSVHGTQASVYKFVYEGAPLGWKLQTGYPENAPGANSPTGTQQYTNTFTVDTNGWLWVFWIPPGGSAQNIQYGYSDDGGDSWTTGNFSAIAGSTPAQPGEADKIFVLRFNDGTAGVGLIIGDELDHVMEFHHRHDSQTISDTWQTKETIESTTDYVDDHIDALAYKDRVFIATKTSVDIIGQPIVVLYERTATPSWSRTTVWNQLSASSSFTRPRLAINYETEEVFVFAAHHISYAQDIQQYQKSDIDSLSFTPGAEGTEIINYYDAQGIEIDNISATKEFLHDNLTGMPVLASDAVKSGGDLYYYWNWLVIPSGATRETKTFTCDAWLATGVTQETKTFTTDSYLKKVNPKSFSSDSYLMHSVTKELTCDSYLVKQVAKTFIVDSWLATRETKTFTVDSYLAGTVTKTFTVDSYLYNTYTKTCIVDAYLTFQYAKDFTSDGWLKKLAQTKACAVDAYLYEVYTKSYTSDAYLGNSFIKSHTADAWLVVSYTKSYTGDAYLKSVESKSYTTDAWLVEQHTKTFTTDAYLKAEAQTKTHTCDAYLISEGAVTKDFTSDAYLRGAQTKAFTSDSYLLEVFAKAYTTDAWLATFELKTFTADTYLLDVYIKEFTSDAYLQESNTKTYSVDSILKAVVGKSYTADGILQAAQVEAYTSDAYLMQQETKTLTCDSYLQATPTKTFTTDGWRKALALQKGFTCDSIISGGEETKEFTTDAYLHKLYVEVWSVDSFLAEERTKAFTCDGMLRWPFGWMVQLKVDAILIAAPGPGELDGVPSTESLLYGIPAISEALTGTPGSSSMYTGTPGGYTKGTH